MDLYLQPRSRSRRCPTCSTRLKAAGMQDRDPLQRHARHAGRAGRGAPSSDACSTRCSRSRRSASSSRTRRVYQLAVDRLGVPAEAIAFQSSNALGRPRRRRLRHAVVWCNRYGQRRERLPGAAGGRGEDAGRTAGAARGIASLIFISVPFFVGAHPNAGRDEERDKQRVGRGAVSRPSVSQTGDG